MIKLYKCTDTNISVAAIDGFKLPDDIEYLTVKQALFIRLDSDDQSITVTNDMTHDVELKYFGGSMRKKSSSPKMSKADAKLLPDLICDMTHANEDVLYRRGYRYQTSHQYRYQTSHQYMITEAGVIFTASSLPEVNTGVPYKATL